MRNVKSVFSFVPNLITSLNLWLGCISILFAFNNNLTFASVLIFAAGIFDFFDGMAARLLNAYSELGKMLDSLADVVSFGVAPSVIMFQLLNLTLKNNYEVITSTNMAGMLIASTGFIIAIFSALRLAKFNIDKRQAEYFVGVPTPANAFFIASLPFVLKECSAASDVLLEIYVLIPLTCVLSFLLVAELPMISLKFKNLSFRDNKSRFILLFVSLILLILLNISAYPLIFLLYIVISLIDTPKTSIK